MAESAFNQNSSCDDEDQYSSSKGKMPNRSKKLKIDRLDKLEERVKVIEESVLKLNSKSLVELQKQLSEKTRLLSETNQKLLEIQENFKCIICKSILKKDSITLPCCGQIGCCQECLRTWMNENPSCPLCRSPIDISSCSKIPPSLSPVLKIFHKLNSSEHDVIEV